jgi:hypothetical protein
MEPIRGKEYRNGMQTNRELSGRLQGGGGWVWSGRREENGPFQGSSEGIVLLLGTSLFSLRSQMRGFHDLLREKPYSVLMLG